MSEPNLTSFLSQSVFEASTTPCSSSTNTSSTLPRQLSKNAHNKQRLASKSYRIQKSAATSLHSLSGVKQLGVSRIPTNFGKSATNLRLDPIPSHVLFSIYECSKISDTKVGLCIIDFNLGIMNLFEFMDTQIYIRTIHKLHIFQPTEILLPSSSLSPYPSKLATLTRLNISETCKIRTSPPGFFNKKGGFDSIRRYMMDRHEESSKLTNLLDKDYSLRSAAAAISYSELVIAKADPTKRFRSLRINFGTFENTAVIDSNTIRSLELVENNISKGGLSLYKFLDSTCTAMGKRLLRNNILQPLTDKESINMRFESVRELMNEADLLEDLRTKMKGFQDLDILFTRLLSVNHAAIKPDQKINYVLMLKDALASIKSLSETMEGYTLQGTMLIEVQRVLENQFIRIIEDMITKYINSDCVWATSALEVQRQKTYAIKAGSNGLIDVSRDIYRSTIQEILEEIQQIGEKFNLDVNHDYDSTRGFYIKISKLTCPDVDGLPSALIKRVTKKGWIECTTLDIMKANVRLGNVVGEISLISEEIIYSLLDGIAKEIRRLFMISEAISILDLLCCFASVSKNKSYCIPKFSDVLIVEAARHPILEEVIPNFVANDVKAMENSCQLTIITGCNMSGKSVYLRQIPLLVIMVQIGCPIPAKGAEFPIFEKIHARLCNDSVGLCSSNFTFEMKEMAHIIDDASTGALIIIDELGGGSSIGDGFAISLALTEHLLSVKSVVFLSTHFLHIPRSLSRRPAVVHLHMESIRVGPNRLRASYRLSDQYESVNNYGIMAVSPLFNSKIVDESYRIATLLESRKEKMVGNSGEAVQRTDVELTNQVKLVFNFISTIESLHHIPKGQLFGQLKALQLYFINSFEGK